MYVDQQECTGCAICIPYCPVEAISPSEGAVAIDLDGCVECAICLRYADCPTGAIHESPETGHWPRIVRRQFSDPMTPHATTGRRGRGSGGVKVNDVTGEIKRGEISFALEFGRPGVGTRLAEVEKMARALAEIGVVFEPQSPTTFLLADAATGEMKPDVRGERVLSATLDVHTTGDRLVDITRVIQRVASRLDTVISWGLTVRIDQGGGAATIEELRKLGITPRPNAKVNLGAGRPLVED